MTKPTPEEEKRSLTAPVEQRADGQTVAGYAVVFNSPADIGGMWREIIAPTAFAQTLLSADVRAYFDHDRGRVLGRSSAGTLRLNADSHGLGVEIDLPDTSDGRDVRELIARGDVDGMSFGFRVRHDEWDETTSPPTRTIHEVELIEVSIVSEPAYADTSIGLRSRDDARKLAEIAQREAKRPHILRRLARKAEVDFRQRKIAGAPDPALRKGNMQKGDAE